MATVRRTEFGERLWRARKHAGLTQKQVEKLTGIPQSTTSTAEREGESSTDTAVYAKLYGVNAHWLATGEGDMLDPNVSLRMRRVYVSSGLASGGLRPGRTQDGDDQPANATGEYAEVGTNDHQAFLFEIKGPSMYPKYESGNFALIEPNAPIDTEDVVLFQPKEGEPMIKRLLSQRNGRYTFGSYNDPEILEYKQEEISWMYYSAHEVPRKRIKSRF